MKHFVRHLASKRELLFGWMWRLTLLVLPWQTRWMHPASVGDWPWEQGTLAVFASWVPLLLTIWLGRPVAKRQLGAKTRRSLRTCLGVLLIVSAAAILSADPITRQARAIAVGQWWAEVLLLGAFGLTLWRASVEKLTLAKWFVFSLVPHAVLGWAQYAYQGSPVHPWLGLPYRSGKELGASVVQHGDQRILRAYGGFPHPNIFGGWLALGLPLALDFARRAMAKWQALAYAIISALFAAVLILTYSRGAWVVALVALGFLAVRAYRERRDETMNTQYFGIACFCALAISGAVIYSQREHLIVRFQGTERLEVKSLETRKQSLVQGKNLLHDKPLVGSGPNAVLLDAETHADRSVTSYLRGPLEPPHMVYELALVEFGILGFIPLLWLGWFTWKQATWRMPLVVIALLGLTDHYPWSTWSGMVLVMLCIALAYASQTGEPVRETSQG